MTKANASIIKIANTEATMRITGSAISKLLTDAGLSQTSDTGQINWATVSKPTAGYTLLGYEIRTIPTSIGSLVLKFSYYTNGATSGNGLTFRYEVGTGSDGSGAITGSFGPEIVMGVTSGSGTSYVWADTSPTLCYASTWDGGCAVVLFPFSQTVYDRHCLIVDRTCNSSGVMDNKGILFVSSYYLNSDNNLRAFGYSSTTLLRSAFPAFPARLSYPYNAYRPSVIYNGKRPFSVLKHLTPEPRWHQNVIIASADDSGAGAILDVPVFGTTKRYLSVGTFFPGANSGLYSPSSADKTAALCFRYE